MLKTLFSLLFILTVCKNINAQTNYSTQTFENLQKLKADAVKANDLAKAADIKKELEIRDAEKKKITDLQIDLDKKVKAEDFTGAATAKEELRVLKDNKAKKDELRQQIATAVAGSDFDKASKLKSELGALTLQDEGKNPNSESNSNPKNPVASQGPAKTFSASLTVAAAPEVKYELSSSGDLSVNGVKLCNVKQTKKANWLIGRGNEYVVYDNLGQEKLKTKGYPDAKIIFLDDKKSFVPNTYASIEELAKFIAGDSLFTARGYNANYKCDFIKKHLGSCYDINAKPGENYLNFELIENDVFVYGKKMFSVKKTRAGNMLFETMAEFTVYDINGKGWMYFEGKEGKMMFMDDGKSFLSRKCDASVKSVAEFIASDRIFTEKGFNTDYRDEYIKRHGGYNASAKIVGERNRSAPLSYIESMIMQGSHPIGTYKYSHEPNTEKSKYQILNGGKVVVGYVTVLNETSLTESMVTINVEAVDQSGKTTDSKSFSELKGSRDYLSTGLKWLIANNFL